MRVKQRLARIRLNWKFNRTPSALSRGTHRVCGTVSILRLLIERGDPIWPESTWRTVATLEPAPSCSRSTRASLQEREYTWKLKRRARSACDRTCLGYSLRLERSRESSSMTMHEIMRRNNGKCVVSLLRWFIFIRSQRTRAGAEEISERSSPRIRVIREDWIYWKVKFVAFAFSRWRRCVSLNEFENRRSRWRERL